MLAADWKIRPLLPSESLERLTDLIHRAYAPHLAHGLRFVGTHQTVEVQLGIASNQESGKRGPKNVAAKAASMTPKYSSTPIGKFHSMKFLARSIA